MHFSFCKFGGREHSIGVRGEEGGFEPPKLLAGGGDRSRRGTDTFCLFLSPPVTNPNWENSKCVIECHILAIPSSAQMSPQLGPGLHMKDGSSHGPQDLSFPPTFFFSFSQLCSSFPLFYTYAFFPSLSLVRPLFPSLFIQLASKKKTIVKRGGVSLAFCISVVAIFKVETLLEIPRSSVSSNR